MTVITEDFRRLDGVAPFPADLAFVYFTVPRRRQNSGGDWVVVPVEVKCRLAAGKLTSPNLDPGEATVRIGPHGPTYKIIIPATDTKLWELIETYEPADPPVVSLVKQYRDEIERLKDDIEVAADTFSTTVGQMVESAHTSATTADARAGQAATSATAAAGSASAAATSASAAGGSATTANTKASDAETARAAAVAAKTDAETARTNADTAASTAGSKASEARGHATEAAGSATAAAGSASTASSAATTAGTQAGQAASAAQAAAQSAVEAANAVSGVASVGGFSGAVTKTQLQIDQVDNTRDVDKPISDPTSAALQGLLEQVGTAFGDLQTEVAEKQDATQVLAAVTAKIADLVGEAPTTLDTIYEIAAALQAEQGATAALTAAIGLRAMADAVVNLAGNQTITGVKNFTGTLQKGGKDVVVTDDARMTNARTPTTHTHSPLEITGLADEFSYVYGALDAKLDTNKIIPVSSLPGTLTNGTFYFVYTP